MPSLEKAKFVEITAAETPAEVPGTSIDVQFNPQSLKLAFSNKLGKQATEGVQDRQYLGPTSATLSFELQFDTSDEGTTDAPVSVRTRTSAIERFLQPKGAGKEKQRPPKARFIWHELRIDGIIEDLSLDIDLFAADGTPLRAKMSVTIKEQDAKYMFRKIGAGANTAGAVRPPGAGGAGPGSFGAGIGASFGAGVSASVGLSASLTDSTSLALAGESAAEFATRVGLDPAAWRSVTGGLDSTLSLAGGAEVDFNASVSVSGGVGVSVGLEAGASASLEGSFGLDARAAVPTPAGIALGGGAASAGFALASAGGVTAALETVSILRAANAASATKAAFGAPPGNATAAAALGTTNGTATAGAALPAGNTPLRASPAPPDQPRAPLIRTGLPSIAAQAAAPPAPAPPVADPRATSFGFGVPLRPRVGGAAETRRGVLGGQIPLRPDEGVSATIDSTPDSTAAPWTYLPVDKARAVADVAQRARHPIRPCGCLGPCGHGAVR
jgi:Contractile injection system tube protein